MKQTIEIPVEDHVVHLAADIVYGQRPEWCEAKYRQLHLSFMKQRCHYQYDEKRVWPLLVWLCGGSFAEVDRNVWMPEMVYFAKHGYAVASVEYSTLQLTRFPDQLRDVKLALRYLRAHARELSIDPDRVAVMGESAGGYLSLLTSMSGKDQACDKGDYPEQSSEVQAAVAVYPVSDSRNLGDPDITHCAADVANHTVLTDLVSADLPPIMILHGMDDTLVDCRQSETLYAALEAAGARADLCLVKGANHADHHFVQDACKARIVAFLDPILKS